MFHTTSIIPLEIRREERDKNPAIAFIWLLPSALKQTPVNVMRGNTDNGRTS